MECKWILPPQPDPVLVSEIARRNGIHSAVASVLASRGFDADASEIHLNPSLANLHDPFAMKGMEKVVQRILKAMSEGERILVYGDYDVDGIAGGALLYRFFKAHNHPVEFYIPDRLEEGYGLSAGGVEFAKKNGATLLITVDCGISDFDEVKMAGENGIDVIITDHHEATSELPPAHTILNPKCEGETYPFPDLSGCGVAFKLRQGLSTRLGESAKESLTDLDLVALATVCDIVPLVGENRILAKFGIDLLSDSSRPGIAALKDVAGLKEKQLSAYHLGFVLGPRLNAAGRIASPVDAFKLLVTDDPDEAGELASKLNAANARRKELHETIADEATRMVEQEMDLANTAGIVLAADGWHEGVIGIVASKIVERFHRPTIIVSIDGECGKGSGRSVRNLNLYGVLEQCKDLLKSFGGHEQAAGLTIEKCNLAAFRERFDAAVKEAISISDLGPKLFVDAKIGVSDIDAGLLSSLDRLKPLGSCTPGVLFVSEDVEVVGTPFTVGKGHLKFKVRDKDVIHEAIAFDKGKMLGMLTRSPRIGFVYAVYEDQYLGRKKLALNVRDIRIIEE